ncbi:MAG: phage terminase small subunit [Rhodanobacter sp.]
MPSPAQMHRQRMLAQITAEAAGESATAQATGSAYDLMRAKLAEDKRSLKALQSREAKIELKRKLLPEYAAWVDGVIAADKPVQDDVVATVMVWAIDTGNIAPALAVAAYMLKHDLKLPEHYKRDLPTTLVEEIADEAGRPGNTVTAAQLLQVGALTEGRDMPDEVKSKLHKAIGLALRDTAPAQALEHLQRALQLNARSGVKSDISKLEKQLAGNAKTQPAN